MNEPLSKSPNGAGVLEEEIAAEAADQSMNDLRATQPLEMVADLQSSSLRVVMPFPTNDAWGSIG